VLKCVTDVKPPFLNPLNPPPTYHPLQYSSSSVIRPLASTTATTLPYSHDCPFQRCMPQYPNIWQDFSLFSPYISLSLSLLRLTIFLIHWKKNGVHLSLSIIQSYPKLLPLALPAPSRVLLLFWFESRTIQTEFFQVLSCTSDITPAKFRSFFSFLFLTLHTQKKAHFFYLSRD